MEISSALNRVAHWRATPGIRPTPQLSREVSITLADQVALLREYVTQLESLLLGQKVYVRRGNPDRGPETGPGYGREVAAILVELPEPGSAQVRCQLLEDDPGAVGWNRAGDVGHWGLSHIRLAT